MSTKKQAGLATFADEAEHILSLQVAHRVNKLGGYGPDSEVIYEGHPSGCPSVLVDSQGDATVTFMSNGSTAFVVSLEGGFEVPVLAGSFDAVEKREIGTPSNNVWLDITTGSTQHIASLINPRNAINCTAAGTKIVKLGDPDRAMWHCAFFKLAADTVYETAVKHALVYTAQGPALMRHIYVRNTGQERISGRLWTYFNLHGTQKFVYNKELWYDNGLAVSDTELVVVAVVPYSDLLQIKRVSSHPANARAVEATCDYSTFIGDTAAYASMPEAVKAGRMLTGGARRNLNRFATAAIAANEFTIELAPGDSASVRQSLLYVNDQALMDAFRATASIDSASYNDVSRAFGQAAEELISRTPGADHLAAGGSARPAGSGAPFFELELPHQKTVSEYANSVWTGVKELYENCRAHGARLANGIELGTRDRAQDMWPKMKEDPGRVRTDLAHALSFMYVTSDSPPATTGPLTLRQKLHGMFPRQYPSRWDDRSQEVYNDNRPYVDSPLWLINSVCMYIRETSDHSILRQRVPTIRLTDPDHPETSGIVGCDVTHTIVEVVLCVLECFQRHVADTPYGMAQILYGDWCDPIDMFGTSIVGDASTRGRGQGVQTRLSAHLFECIIQILDILEVPSIAKSVASLQLSDRLDNLRRLADQLRQNVVNWAWEDGPGDIPAGFVAVIHELNKDGSRPDYSKKQTGYTLGSFTGRDFDGVNRRELSSQAYCLQMLLTDRDYLTPIQQTDKIIEQILETTDRVFFNEKLGLVMFSEPFANNELTIKCVGRMGVVPAGCAENGEYHHGQVFMHRYRLLLPHQADQVWQQFKPIMSAMRDESIAGPFETPCTSYVSNPEDPHFGKGMYFGLSGSVDWIVQIIQAVAGVKLALHDEREPDVRVEPNLPRELDETLTFRRIIHRALPDGGYRRIPFTLHVRKQGTGPRAGKTMITVNGRTSDKAELRDLTDVDRVDIEITYVHEN